MKNNCLNAAKLLKVLAIVMLLLVSGCSSDEEEKPKTEPTVETENKDVEKEELKKPVETAKPTSRLLKLLIV